jgi:hypothetical protein
MTAVASTPPVRHPSLAALAAAVVCVLFIGVGTARAQAQATYLFSLANFGGPLSYNGVRFSIDHGSDETYVIYQNIIQVFNASGMETFRFGEDLDVGQILDVAVDANGDILLLSSQDSRTIVTRCNFRGVPIGRMEFSGFAAGQELRANRMVLRNGLLYFALLSRSEVTVTDLTGRVRSVIDVISLLEPEDRRDGVESVGFFVDGEGSMFLTMPTLFRVVKRAADGTVTSFGKAGPGTGRFGIIAGVASDSHGNIFVTDKLKSTVIAFDKDFNFLTEFGFGGRDEENVFIPDGIGVDRQDRIYISQWHRRGVSVFSFTRQ